MRAKLHFASKVFIGINCCLAALYLFAHLLDAWHIPLTLLASYLLYQLTKPASRTP